MYSPFEAIKKQLNDLFPDGLAFRASPVGVRSALLSAISQTYDQCFKDAESVWDSMLPDNPNFTADDATDWERRLGIISGTGVSLPDRKLAITRKLNYPGTVAPRQHWTYLEEQLQAAGFDVYVYENNFSGVTKTPQNILNPGDPEGSVHSIGTYHKSTTRHGSIAFYTNKVANYIEEEKDESFIIGANYRSTFFISGPVIETFADVPENRKDEFRQMILKLKPAQTVAFLFVNYI
ncbi:MAG: hypothetical protein WC756_03740 [Taibaiella sp.]|jgi:uncharacterized protein YmfQ (DUF2313 family)